MCTQQNYEGGTALSLGGPAPALLGLEVEEDCSQDLGLVFAPLDLGVTLDLLLIFLFSFSPLEWGCLSYVCPITVFWKHVTYLIL